MTQSCTSAAVVHDSLGTQRSGTGWHDGPVTGLKIERLPSDGLARLADIDRSEHVETHYRQEGDRLIAEPVDWQVPDFAHDGEGEYSVAGLVGLWQPVVDGGGILLGALEGNRLVGLGLLRHDVRPRMAQVALLFVSHAERRLGVARALMDEMDRLARAGGARSMYVSAIPSGSAVGFYLAQGFTPTAEPLPELFALEPEDIHMTRSLA